MTQPTPIPDQLPAAEAERIFQEKIVPVETGHARPQPRPTVVFLIAQPGAGKSRVARQIGTIFDGKGGFIDVDSDRYKPFHPSYEQFMDENDRTMVVRTRFDGRRWMHMIQDYARRHRLNTLVQATAGNSAGVAEDMSRYREAGYQIAVATMGVPEAMSRQGIIHRYHEQVRDRGRGRLTAPENARRSYAGILDLADLIDTRHLADQVAVFRRGEAEPRYFNHLTPAGQWAEPPRLRAAIETERTRPWTPQETGDFQAVQRTLAGEAGPEWTPQLAEIDTLARPLFHPSPPRTPPTAMTDAARVTFPAPAACATAS
ncbi:zeta toxin family protein [Frankia sp. CiP3]|uniref:zeta toxin family protein n=1 Tax=Frankia sp. CiP3 TaxID=2880971 RepID=UPI001EF454C6|nr:zeta toxin family protein [Frankia sp. CiP3]